MTLRNVIVMLVLAALAVGALLMLGDDAGPDRRLPATMPDFRREDVSKVSVRMQGESLQVRRRADRRDAWELLVDTEYVRADSAAVDELLRQLSGQDVVDRFEDVPAADAAKWGLAEPSAEIELVSGEKTVTVRYGQKSREGGSVYADTGPGTAVWVVSAHVYDSLPSLLTGGVRDLQATDVRSFDVARLEIERRDGPTVAVERDLTHIWRFEQPFEGYAHPARFETELQSITGARIPAFVESGAQDLVKYGLDRPRAEVRVHSKHREEPVTLLVGAPAEADGNPEGAYAMEKGYRHVFVVPPRFVEAVFKDPALYRDKSFSRLGIDGVALRVKLGGAPYRLQKQGTTWDITEPDRFPADGEAVDRALKAIRAWHTKEFRDGADPAEFGISDERVVEVDLQGGGTIRYRIGDRAEQGDAVWAQRIVPGPDGEGGVELVEAGPVELLEQGYLQFRRRIVRDYTNFMLSDLERLARDAAPGVPDSEVQTIAVKRDPNALEPFWELDGPGVTGELDLAALQKVIAHLMVIRAEEWVPWTPERNAELGLEPYATMLVTLEFVDRGAEPPGGHKQTLFIGKRRPEGGYHARFHGDDWAFILSDDYVEKLKARLAPD